MIGRVELDCDIIDYSQAEDISSVLNFAGGSFGFQQFGAGQVNFTLGAKDSKIALVRSGTFRMILGWAAKTPAVLYDKADQRAWLFNAGDVILHIVQIRIRRSPFLVRGKDMQLKISGGTTETLHLNEHLVLSEDGETVSSMVSSIWSTLEFLRDERINAEKSPDLPMKTPFRRKLAGYELMDVVEEISPLHKKQSTIERSCGGWPSLIRDIDALVLFANGLGELIKPGRPHEELCHTWQTMPKGKDYLATIIPVLLDLFATAGSRDSREHLTSSHLSWVCGKSLFEPCQSLHLFLVPATGCRMCHDLALLQSLNI